MNNISSGLDETVFIYHDPFLVHQEISHHPKVYKFVTKLVENEEINLRIQHNSRIIEFNAIRILGLGIKTVQLFLQSIKIIFEISKLKKFQRVIYFNPNMDPITLALILFSRKIFNMNFEVRLRFICTVDRVLTKHNPLIFVFLNLMGRILDKNDKLCGESRNYSALLTKRVGFNVSYLEFPPIDDVREINLRKKSSNKIVALYVGKPRIDKGYLNLVDIGKRLSKGFNVEFRIQSYNSDDLELIEASTKLQSLGIVTMLNSQLSDYEIMAEIQGCDLIILPYDRDEFRFRNSGFAFTSLYFGKYVAAYKGTTLYDTANEIGLAVNLENIEKFIFQYFNSQNITSLNSDNVKAKWRNFLL